MLKEFKNTYKYEIFPNFKKEIFLWLKIILIISILIFWFLFWRIYENKNFFSKNPNDNYTLIEIKKISNKWIEWKINFWSLKIYKDWKKFSFWVGWFFIKN